MANSAQARKRARQSEKHRQHNAARRSMLRTHVKNVKKALKAGTKEAASDALQQAIPVIDRLARKGLIHKNMAARNKSRLNALLKAL